MPVLGEEPVLLEYQDGSYTIDWWPHLVYRIDQKEIFEHNVLAITAEGKEIHRSYVESR